MRSRIVLGAAKAAPMWTSPRRWAAAGLEVVEPFRPAPTRRPLRQFDDAKVEEVVVKTLEETPRDATHWSTRSMANAVGLSQSTKSPLTPSSDLAGLYLNPPDAAVVLCVDHKSQIQALDRTAPILPLIPSAGTGPPTSGLRRHGQRPGHHLHDTA